MPDTPVGYTTVEELARILKIRTPTNEQTAAMTRVLGAAALEIDKEIDRPDDAPELNEEEFALAAEVNLERATEHWLQEESPFGVLGLGQDAGGIMTARDSWQRHALKLVPLKLRWGIA